MEGFLVHSVHLFCIEMAIKAADFAVPWAKSGCIKIMLDMPFYLETAWELQISKDLFVHF